MSDEQNSLLQTLEPNSDDRAWYVVHCYSGYENKVRHSIEQRIETMGMQDKIFDVVVPTEEEIRKYYQIVFESKNMQNVIII